MLLIPLIPILASGLCHLFLPSEALLYEGNWLTVGILLLHGAALFFALGKRASVVGSGDTNVSRYTWLLFASGMVVIQGGALFLVKLFSRSLPHGTFLPSWYVGAVVGSLIIVRIEGKADQLSRSAPIKVFPVALMTMSAMAATFWALKLAPAGLVLPLRAFVSSLAPFILLVVSWIVFREWEGISRWQVIGYGCGTLGVISIVLSQWLV